VKALSRTRTEDKHRPDRKPEHKQDPKLDHKPDHKHDEKKAAPIKEKLDFGTGDLVVYPTHGVGKILGIEKQEIAGFSLSVFVVLFDKDRMTLRVPVNKAKGSGLRRLSSRKEMDAALAKLKGRSRAKRTMWSRRAQEYEAKINSGDPGSIAEVVRDLYRNAGQPEQSYSERQIYQAALDRLVREFAAVEKIDENTATRRVEQMLSAA
jgi:CarD family transcriptional regulator